MFQTCVVLFFLALPFQAQAEEVKALPWCDSHREFVTTLEYMRKQDHYELGEQNSRKVAEDVSRGCTGAAKRYVKVYELLKKVEAGARTSITTAKDLAQKSDSHVETFMSVFKNAYSQDELDLDLNNSLKIAKALAVDYKGNPKKAKQDYSELVAFCLDQKKVGGSVPTCAKIALEVTKSGERFEDPVARGFIEVFNFLQSQKSLNFQISKTLTEAKKVAAIHPKAAGNYIASFRYAQAKKGLNATATDSLKFANSMARNTLPVRDASEPERLPASKISE